ncbi:spermidine/putrescine ABC transporter substrate-binding protein [Clostridium sp.]|uniref:ABC transporter substrate-binding protein n=1 Tax=Clostridium sp. TaxID=1506 RepID=UPI002624CA98|nr:spermidine/putrescine ABC transporter substrate-binding protein [Clostridium sp.]
MKKNKVRLLTLIISTLFIINGLVGCSSSEKKEEINILNYGANAAEGVYEEFEKETGIKVNEKTFDDMHYMYQEVASGKVKYDVILVSDDMAEKMIKEDMLQNINKDNIPNIVNMNEGDMGKPYDPNNDYTVPYMNGTIGLIYNTETVDEDIDSWESLFDTKYKNEVFMFDNMRDTIGVALKTLGYSLNSTDPNELEEAKNLLIKQKEEINPVYGADEVLDLMKSGEKKIAMIWSGEGLNLETEDSTFKYVIPEEGADYWLDSWAIPKDAQNVSGAEKFINFMSDKDISFRTADEIGYTTPQKQAIEEQPDEVKNNENAYMPKEILDKCEGYKYLDGDSLRLYEDIWMQIKG